MFARPQIGINPIIYGQFLTGDKCGQRDGLARFRGMPAFGIGQLGLILRGLEGLLRGIFIEPTFRSPRHLNLLRDRKEGHLMPVRAMFGNPIRYPLFDGKIIARWVSVRPYI